MASVVLILLGVTALALLTTVLIACIFYAFSAASSGYELLPSSNTSNIVPKEFLNDPESLVHLSEEYDFTSLTAEEQVAYLKAQEFSTNNPPNFSHRKGASYGPIEENALKDKGITAFEFEQDHDFLQPRFIVEDRTEITFVNNELPYSYATAVLNYSLPVKNRGGSDVVYFEVKIFEFDRAKDGHFSIGLVTKPYPSHISLPGYNSFSIGYESTGNLKVNKPLPTPSQQHQNENSKFNAQVLPSLQQSDVVGFGYAIHSGTLFITHNGKKIMDIMKNCYVDLYPAIGCFSTNAKFQVNFGELGFVWVEANVRKYAFVSTTDYKKINGERGLTALPEYFPANKDKILDRGEELPPRYPEEELDFFGRTSIDQGTGSSAQLLRDSEKCNSVNYEKEPKQVFSSTTVTNEPDEVMNLRQRIYEQSTESSHDKADSDLVQASKTNADLVQATKTNADLVEATKTNADLVEATKNNADNTDSEATDVTTNADDKSINVTPQKSSSADSSKVQKKNNSKKKKKSKNGKKKGKKK